MNFEWPNSDRDLHIVMPTLIYLKKYYNINIMTFSIFNAYYYILKYRPKMIIISNYQGSNVNHEVVKLAYQYGIKVITFISEGNTSKNNTKEALFGVNKDNKLYVDKILLWSRRGENYFIKDFPKFQNKFCTVGGTGYDRYTLLSFYDKFYFLKKIKLKYKKIIGIAAWGFDHYFGDYFEKVKDHYIKLVGEKQIEMYRNDLFKLQYIYKQLIENNKDILFILRYHPGTIDFKKNEFYGLENYTNVFISNINQNNEYHISDLISSSDLWIGYETTTSLEAWLMGKQTFLINPSGYDFVRKDIYKGSPIVQTAEEAQNLIDEYFNTKTIKKFQLLKKERKKIVADVIEYSDGQNYKRAANEIIKVYREPEKKIMYSLDIYQRAFKQNLKILLSKTIFPNRWKELDYKSDFARNYQDMYSDLIDDNS